MGTRGWAVMMAVVLLTVAGGCAADTGDKTTTTTKIGAGQESPPPPVGHGAQVGTPYPFQLYTHCGIEWAHIDGDWWKTKARNDGSGNPPGGEGWGNPYDDGTLTLVDHDTAEYVSASGNRLEFRRTTDDGPDQMCA